MFGCKRTEQKNLYLPENTNDKTFSSVKSTDKEYVSAHSGTGYSIYVPEESYRYEKDYDDGAFEETWEHKRFDDVEIKVTTYKNSDEISARSKFLREHDDYVFEDLLGYPLCGVERDGDTLWFHIYENSGNVYIVSWKYDKNTIDDVKTELSEIASTFSLAE